jgi:3,4-dihydroxyphenylacetate 2,3-dioxygenase
MGEIVGACVCGHVPTIMLPQDVRIALGGGEDTTLVAGLAAIRERLDAGAPDTLVIFDTHWFTTTEHVVSGHDHHLGVYTSEELPRVICDLEYDYRGAPELAKMTHAVGKERGVRVTNTTNPYVAHHYPTLNLVTHLHRGERVMSVGVCQTAGRDDFLAFGAVLAHAIGAIDGRVALLASGGMSHRFWPLGQLSEHQRYSPDEVSSEHARELDRRVLAHWEAGDHAAVLDLYAEYRSVSPEGHFGHYLMLVGALGGRACRAPGTLLSRYESSLGTGQVHVWFDLDTAGSPTGAARPTTIHPTAAS